MSKAPPTSWTTIRAAGDGDPRQREEFARRYAPAVRAYLQTRWRSELLREDLDDATQEVFVECFRSGGVLERVDPTRSGGFRAFLYGVARNVAQRFEERRGKGREAAHPDLDGIEQDDATLSVAFDRAWASSLLREAAQRQKSTASSRGPDAQRRVELLELRFQDGLPIREIAARWSVDPAQLHRSYAKAREEFEAALIEIMSELHPNRPGAAREEAQKLIQLLG